MNQAVHPTWVLDADQAHLQARQLHASLNLTRPSAGVREIRVALPGHADQSIDAQILRVYTAGEPANAEEDPRDHFVRGSDLIARYPETATRSFCPEYYWRFISAVQVPACGIEFVVSVQTSLLEAHPTTSICSQLRVSELLRLRESRSSEYEIWAARDGTIPATPHNGQGMFLARLAGSNLSYVEMVHPSDFCRATVTGNTAADGPIELCFDLFAERLEKGVIRRGRVRAAFLPGENDTELAARLYDEFAASSPPLTT